MSGKMDKTCINPDCGKSFEAYKSKVDKGFGKYCSRQCVLAGSIEVRERRKKAWIKAQMADIRFREMH